jgi:predicted dehydrogenase
MLDKAPLDAVVVVCPPDAHRDVAHLAMSRGVSVFVEKPPCTTLDELEALVAVADRTGVVTGVGMNFRFARPIRQVRSIVAKPSFGKSVYLQLNHYASKPTSPLWGLTSTLRSFLLAQTIHTIDLATFFGGPVESSRAAVITEANAMIVEIGLSFTSGATASILTGTMFPYFEFDMKIVSDTSTMLQLDNLWNLTLHQPGYSSATADADKRWRGYWQPGPLDSGFVRSGYKTELDTFFDCVRTRRPFEADFASLLPTYEVIEKICQTGDRLVEAAPAPTASLALAPSGRD